MAKILLVDDDEDMLALSARWLEKAGYEVTKAMSGQEALDALKSGGADLVLLDYAIPEMDGPDVLRAIRQDDSLKDTPVFFRTGMDDQEIAEVVAELNPQKVLPKSEGKGALLAAVAEII